MRENSRALGKLALEQTKSELQEEQRLKEELQDVVYNKGKEKGKTKEKDIAGTKNQSKEKKTRTKKNVRSGKSGIKNYSTACLLVSLNVISEFLPSPGRHCITPIFFPTPA